MGGGPRPPFIPSPVPPGRGQSLAGTLTRGCSTFAFPSLSLLASRVGTALVGPPPQEGRNIQLVLTKVVGPELLKITKPELFIRRLTSTCATPPEENPTFRRPGRIGSHLYHV